MARIRALAANDLIRSAGLLTVWIALHLYAARPLVAAACVEGVPHPAAWGVVLLIPFVSMLPLLARRAGAARLRSAAHWIGYATMSLFSVLLFVVLGSDVVRLILHLVRATVSARVMSFAAIDCAAVLALIGFVQARRPRVVELPIAFDGLSADLDGYRIVQWSDVHIGPTIRR